MADNKQTAWQSFQPNNGNIQNQIDLDEQNGLRWRREGVYVFDGYQKKMFLLGKSALKLKIKKKKVNKNKNLEARHNRTTNSPRQVKKQEAVC